MEPLLRDGLTEIQRVSLASLKQHPGFKVLEQLHFDACTRATEALVRLSPEEENYQQKLSARQIKARERSEFSLLILGSIDWHIAAASVPQQEAEEKPEGNRILQYKGMQK